jgi:hypothetical protein
MNIRYATPSDCAWCGTGNGLCQQHAEGIYRQQAVRHQTQRSTEGGKQDQQPAGHPNQGAGKGDHHVWGHHPAPKWSFREEDNIHGRKEQKTRKRAFVGGGEQKGEYVCS